MFTTDISKKKVWIFILKGWKIKIKLDIFQNFAKISLFFLLKVGPFENLKSYGFRISGNERYWFWEGHGLFAEMKNYVFFCWEVSTFEKFWPPIMGYIDLLLWGPLLLWVSNRHFLSYYGLLLVKIPITYFYGSPNLLLWVTILLAFYGFQWLKSCFLE